jgi:glutamyl-Q tRNA(Asp) synthetase
VAALASWLDARAHGGVWLVRIEDIDTPRCVPGNDTLVLAQLARCGLVSDEPVVWQSQRYALYRAAIHSLLAQDLAYPCGCSRTDIASVTRPPLRHPDRVYPGTCRDGLHGKAARSIRVRTECARHEQNPTNPQHLTWHDRRQGPQSQNLTRSVGDFVVQRADGLFAYQLVVVADDAAQGITHVVRGEDLLDNTPRQIYLQSLLHYPTPSYLHTPLVRSATGQKLSKQNGAPALELGNPWQAIQAALAVLQLPIGIGSAGNVSDGLAYAIQAWKAACPNLKKNGT